MKQTIYICTLLMLYTGWMSARPQPATGKQLPVQEPPVIKLFSAVASGSSRSNTLHQFVSQYQLLQADSKQLETITSTAQKNIQLEMPIGDAVLTLQLSRNKTLDANTILTVQNGSTTERVNYTPGVYYSGNIKGKPHSVVALSFFNNNIAGVISYDGKNLVIGKSKDPEAKRSEYIVYDDHNLNITNSFTCHTNDQLPGATFPSSVKMNVTPVGGVNVYLEADYQLFLDHGSDVAQVFDYISGVFNVVVTLYRNESINIRISQIKIFMSPDPYLASNSVSGVLGLFQNAMNGGFNGDLAQLLSSRPLGGGQASDFGVLCNADNKKKTSVAASLESTVPHFPVYSWTANVVTHEIGHNLGSRHTHACVWNGNNTAIDGCSGFTEGGCPLPPVPAKGTIMSYCHLASEMDFTLGFGPQPGNVIRNHVINSGCLSAVCPSDLIVSGLVYQPLLESATWIRNFGPTIIASSAQIKMDAHPTNGFIELLASNTDEYFLASYPTADGVFIAQALDGCDSGIPSKPDDPATDLKENTGTDQVTIFPNPSNGRFDLNIKLMEAKSINVTVYDVLGQEIFSQDLGVVSDVRTPVNISEQHTGLYLIRIQSGNDVITRQVIINR